MDTDLDIQRNPDTDGKPGSALLDCAQAAHYINVSQSFIRKAVGGKRIPYVQLGRRILFRRLDLDHWIAEHVVITSEEVRAQARAIAATTMLRKDAR